MKKILISIIIITGFTSVAYSAPSVSYVANLLGIGGDNVNDIGSSASSFNDIFYKGNLTNSTFSDGCASWSSGILTTLGVACGSGGGSGGGTWSTTTSQVSGRLINYPNNTSDVVVIGSNATTSAEWWYDPTALIGFLSGKFGIGTTSPYARLSVVGEVVGAYFTATTTTASVFPLANITKLSNLTGNGFVKTSGGDGTLSVDTTTYESGLTAGDGLTRTSNDFDCDTASGSVFGCLASADWTTFNSKQASGNYITALTGDVTASGPGSVAATLATVNGNVGSFTNANITVNGKGLVTAASSGSAPVTSVTGTWPIISSGGATPNITFGGLSTSSPIAAGANVLYATGVNTVASVATGTISVPTGLTVTANRYAIGGSAAIGLDTGYVIPLQSTLDAKAEDATTLTIAGTANQVTSSAGAQDLSTNRTWTLSFPNQVIFPQYASSTLGFSTAYASSTLYYGAGLANCASENMLTWTDGRFGCESDTSGGGGGSGVGWASTTVPSVDNNSITFTGTNTIMYGTELAPQIDIFGGGYAHRQSSVNTPYGALYQYMINRDTSAGSVGCMYFGNDKTTIGNPLATTEYVGGLCFAGSNWDTPGFNALRPNGLALYADNGPLTIGSASLNAASSTIYFQAGGGLDAAYDMVLQGGTGNLGVGNITPTYKIDVNGDINIRTAQYYRQNSIPILYGTSTSVFVGGNSGALFSVGAGSDFVTGIGYQSFYNASSSLSDYSTGVGYQALYNNNGLRNTAIGYQAMFKNYTGGSNVAIGAEALKNNLTGGTNIAIGNQALINLTSVNDVIGIGNGALGSLTTGGGNTAVGYQAGGAIVSNLSSTFYGSQAGQYATGGSNVIVGEGAGLGSAGSSTFTEAAILGYRAGRTLTTGLRNTIVGANAGNDITTGTTNTCVGAYACDGLTGSTNLAIGYNTGLTTAAGTGQINIMSAIFGTSANADSATPDVDARIGIGSTTPQARLGVENIQAVNSFQVNDEARDLSPFIIGASGNTAIATSTVTGNLNIGPITANGTSTIMMGKLQFDGYNSAGSRKCIYLDASDAWVVTTGACTNP